MEDILKETRDLMKQYHLRANKSLGQNFLIDSQAVEDIVESANITKEDLVIEIGPGLGTLTKGLIQKAGKVVCIELDPKMVKVLQDRFGRNQNFELIHQDVLKVDLAHKIKEEKETGEIKNTKVVANLPYYITTPIIMKLLESKLDIQTITVMIQKEVAERLIEAPGGKKTGAITYATYFYCSSRKIREVEASAFLPEPEVTSEVIELTVRSVPPIEVEDTKLLFKIIKSAFMQRRKTLLNALVNTKVFINKEEGMGILEKIHISPDIRAEKLTLQDFANLTNEFIKNLKK